MTHIEKFWRDATAADVARAMARENVEARFRDNDFGTWHPGRLWGVKVLSDGRSLWLTGGASWRYCQVYSPPQWFLDKPDPGEGYRLLGKFPDEALQVGDEFFEHKRWWPVFLENPYPQVDCIWYRRKIEPPKPEPKHYVLQVGDTVETGNGFSLIVTEHGVEVT